MAADAPYSGTRSRAPENPTTAVPSQNITADAQSIGAEISAIDAMILGAAALLSIVRHKACVIEGMAQGIELAAMRANGPAAA